jgi:RNA polymerase sigma-70 factor (ECF subfamily)
MVDRDLVERAQRGDHEAFEAIAIGVSGRLYSIARLILRDTHLAEDAVQEALVNVWRRLPTLRDPDRFDAWAYRLLVNACADAGRGVHRFAAEVRLLPEVGVARDAQSDLAERDRLERGFRHLRPEQRTALVLHHYVGLSAVEVAEITGVSVGTVKSRIHYATAAMRAAIEADERGSAAAAGGRS